MNGTVPLTISSWSLGDQCSFRERVEAASRAGFTGIGLRAETYVDALQEGYTDRTLLELLERYGLRVTEVEYIVQWAEQERSYAQMYKEQICFHMCRLFGVSHINCGLMEAYPVADTAEKLAALCGRAQELFIGVEPMPYSGIPNVHRAWEIVRESRCDNAGIILDSWHWVRANHSNSVTELAEIPPHKILSIQINDVLERPYAASVLRDESMHDRLAPGTGYGDTLGFLQMIRAAGIQPKVFGVEVISEQILSRGVAQAADYLYQCTAPLVQKVWGAD